jgi:hypothetical protein
MVEMSQVKTNIWKGRPTPLLIFDGENLNNLVPRLFPLDPSKSKEPRFHDSRPNGLSSSFTKARLQGQETFMTCPLSPSKTRLEKSGGSIYLQNYLPTKFPSFFIILFYSRSIKKLQKSS